MADQNEEAQRQAWIDKHAALAPPVTWEQWRRANAALGIKVKKGKPQT